MRKTEQKYREDEQLGLRGGRDEEALTVALSISQGGWFLLLSVILALLLTIYPSPLLHLQLPPSFLLLW